MKVCVCETQINISLSKKRNLIRKSIKNKSRNPLKEVGNILSLKKPQTH